MDKIYLNKNDNERFFKFDEIENTNSFLKERENVLKTGSVCCAKSQSSGKGTKDRVWNSFSGDNLALSFLLKGIDFYLLPQFPLICGMIAKECVDELSGMESFIKWPNDIVLCGKKIVGILCESVVLRGTSSIICGTGINLNTEKNEFKKAGLVNGGSILSIANKQVCFEDAVSIYILKANKYLNLYFNSFFSETLKTTYIKNCITINKEVKIIKNGEEIIAKAIGIDNYGRLVCDDNKNIFTVCANEVSIRGISGYAF